MDVAHEVRSIIKSRSPSARTTGELADDLKLYDGGLDLDSLSLIELILECEKRFTVKISREFLDAGNFTLGALIDQICQAQDS